MNILRVADEKSIPWFTQEPEKAPVEKVDDLNTEEEVTEEVLVEECDKIEACSIAGKIYHYNSTWGDKIIRHLREYAIACGMDLIKFKGVEPNNLKTESKSETVVKFAQTQENTLRSVLGDPFHIEEHSDTSYMDKTNWQEVKKQNVLGEPSLDLGDVIALRGGENYYVNSDVNPAVNQNSITNPNAIQQLAESLKDDTGERLRKEKKAKEEQKTANHKTWEQEKIAEMANSDIIPTGLVFPTESLNANAGLSTPSSQRGVYAKFNPDSIPDKTAGEKIADQNKEHKESIQRPKQIDDWQKPCTQQTLSISSSFGESLKAALKK